MSYRNIPPRFEVTQLMDKLLRQISERMKVKLLPLMMETEIVEQVTMHSRVDGSNGIDILTVILTSKDWILCLKNIMC